MGHIDAMDARVVEIRVALPDGGERRGTGFVVAPGRVLTALHVLLGDVRASALRTVPTLAAGIRVRALGDLADHVGDVRSIDPSAAAEIYDERAGGDHLWTAARLLWPEAGARIPRFELAVLEVADTREFRILRDSARITVAEPSDSEQYRAVGFPAWASQTLPDGSTITDIATLHATIQTGGSIYSATTAIHVTSGAPGERAQWSGLSGAPLMNMATKALVGIVSLARDSRGHDVLAATLLSDVIRDEAFAGFWRASRLSKPRRMFHVPFARSRRDTDRELGRLAEAVWRAWIDDVLADSLDQEELLPINVVVSRDGVQPPFAEAERADVLKPADVTEGADPVQIFEDAGRFLLVLGPAGSGKTNCLLRIARELCEQRLRAGGENEPVPVVFPLATWTPRHADLGGWLSLELQRRYKVPPDLCNRWIAERSILPLFDGLDEVSGPIRGACIGAINDFVEVAAPPGAVVCSRPHEYGQAGTPLRLHATLTVRPLDDDVVRRHVRAHGLDRLGQQIETFPVLRTLASSPLMLRVLMRSYRRGGALVIDSTATVAVLRERVWSLYLDAMTAWASQRSTRNLGTDGLVWLRSMARLMLRNSQAVFHIERLQANALEGGRWVAAYAALSRLFTILVAGTITGTVAGFGVPLSVTLGFNPGPVPVGDTLGKLVWDVARSLEVALMAGLVIGAADAARLLDARWQKLLAGAGWMPGAVYAALLSVVAVLLGAAVVGLNSVLLLPFWASLLFGLRASQQSFREDIHLGQYLTWSRPRAATGLVFGGAVGILFLAVGWYKNGLSYGVIYAAAAMAVGAMWAGLTVRAPTLQELRLAGPRLWTRNALLAGVLFGGAIACTVAGIGWLVARLFQAGAQDFWSWAAVGVTKGAIVAVVAFFIYGGLDLVHHWHLRAVLGLSRTLPLRLNQMLGWAADRCFLIRVGSGYIFVHRDLQLYLGGATAPSAMEAETAVPASADAAARTVSGSPPMSSPPSPRVTV
jgi:hypothetical protein